MVSCLRSNMHEVFIAHTKEHKTLCGLIAPLLFNRETDSNPKKALEAASNFILTYEVREIMLTELKDELNTQGWNDSGIVEKINELYNLAISTRSVKGGEGILKIVLALKEYSETNLSNGDKVPIPEKTGETSPNAGLVTDLKEASEMQREAQNDIIEAKYEEVSNGSEEREPSLDSDSDNESIREDQGSTEG